MTVTLDSLRSEIYLSLAEHKIDLIDGRLIISNDLKNSLATLQLILAGWGAEAAVALAPISLWWKALKTVCAEVLPPALREAGSEKNSDQWQEWSQNYSHWRTTYPIKVHHFHA